MWNKLLPDIVERSEKGPYMKGSDFDMKLAERTARLVKEHEIKFDREVIVPADDAMADRVYEAGLKLFTEMGVYNNSTERRILFSREEVEYSVDCAISNVMLGTGREAVRMRHRGVESSIPPVIFSGPTGTPVSEKYHRAILTSTTQEPVIDSIDTGSCATYKGKDIIPGTPLEILAVRRDASMVREVIRDVGRPGIHIRDLATPLTCAGKFATINGDYGMRPGVDGLIVSQMVELKTDYDQLARVAHYNALNIHPVDLLCPLVGGMGGGAEGTAVLVVASHLLGIMLYNPTYHIWGHMNLLKSFNSDRIGLWVFAVAGQALARNTRLLTSHANYTANGLGTEECLWEAASVAIVGTVCGTHHEGVGPTGGAKVDHNSGIENRLDGEIGHACVGMSRGNANRLALECLKHYEDTLFDPKPGKPFPEVYDVDTVTPKAEWLETYAKVRKEMETLGLDMNAWKKRRQENQPGYK